MQATNTNVSNAPSKASSDLLIISELQLVLIYTWQTQRTDMRCTRKGHICSDSGQIQVSLHPIVYRNLLKSLSVAQFPHKPELKTHFAVFNCYTPFWILKLSNPCFRVTRWAVNPDIFLLSPQRTPSTWPRHQISKSRLLLSSISLLRPSLWCAESVHWNTGGKQIYITVLRFKPLCSSIITLPDISQNSNTQRSFESC